MGSTPEQKAFSVESAGTPTKPSATPTEDVGARSLRLEMEKAIRTLQAIKQRASELKHSGVYQMSDIEELAGLAGPIFQDYWQGVFKEDVRMELLIEQVFGFFFSMSSSLEQVSDSLQSIYVDLARIHADLFALWKYRRCSFNTDDVLRLQKELAQIEALRKDGVFRDPKTGKIPAGQAVLSSMLEKCYRLAHTMLVELEVMEHTQGVDPRLATTYARLVGIHSALHSMIMGDAAQNEKDLLYQQEQLAEISQQQASYRFVDAKGEIPRGQAVSQALLDKCYRLAHYLTVSNETGIPPIARFIPSNKNDIEPPFVNMGV